MSIDTSRLEAAVSSLDRTLDGLREAADRAAGSVVAEAEAGRTALENVVQDHDLPDFSLEPDSFPGLQGLTAALAEVARLPDDLAASQDEMLAAATGFEGQVAEFKDIADEAADLLQERQAAFAELMEDAEDMMASARDGMQGFIDAATETVTATLQQELEQAGSELFQEIEADVRSLFSNALETAIEGAVSVSGAASQIKENFEEAVSRFLNETLTEGFERIVNSVLSEVLEDVASSQALATAVQQINVAIASAAPQLAAGLKAFGAVKRALELARM